MADVAGCFLAGHAVDVGAQGDPLVQGGQDAEPEPGPQGGLADEQGGEAGRRVEVVAGEHADRLELAGVELVGFIQDQDGGPAPFFCLGGQRVGGLGQQGAGVEPGCLAAGDDDLLADAADADAGRVGQVDGPVPDRVGAARAARTDAVFPDPTSPVSTATERLVMAQVSRATASAWPWWRCSWPGAMSRPNGILVNP